MIGIFDSGLGGLTVLNELIKALPENNFVYLADSAKAPYGDKTKKEIYQLTLRAVDFLFAKGCRLIILACNTASSNALRKLQKDYLPAKYPDRKILGIVVPNIEAVVENIFDKRNHRQKSITVIGTRATIKSQSYEKELKKCINGLSIYSKACPKLVPLIEDENFDSVLLQKHLKKYLSVFKNIDVILPACSHYVLIKKEIKNLVGPDVKILDTSKIIARKTVYYLNRHPEIKDKQKTKSRLQFYTTGDKKVFKNFAENYLKREIKITNVQL
jgi:glutamate racemase